MPTFAETSAPIDTPSRMTSHHGRPFLLNLTHRTRRGKFWTETLPAPSRKVLCDGGFESVAFCLLPSRLAFTVSRVEVEVLP
jgi:hypothetical protein